MESSIFHEDHEWDRERQRSVFRSFSADQAGLTLGRSGRIRGPKSIAKRLLQPPSIGTDAPDWLDTIKTAAEFVRQHGDIEDALAAIDQVGKFITQCGNAAKAKAALKAYKAMAAVIG